MPRSPTVAKDSGGAAPLGALLREWRSARRWSQLDLALEAGISSRHLSYVETGRAQPSRELVARLAETLGMPLRERNALLLAAGFAPLFPESALATRELEPMRRAAERILAQQEPYPAFVLDRRWNLLATNRAAARVTGFLLGREPAPEGNMVRLFFDPALLRPVVVNWEEVAGDLVRHLHDEVAASPSDAAARALLDEALAFPGVPARWRRRELGAAPSPILTTVFRRDGRELRFFSTITSFATPRDVTLDETRIECSFPEDEATTAFCRELATSGPGPNRESAGDSLLR